MTILLTDTFTAGVLAGLAVTNEYDPYLRRTDLATVGSGLLSHTVYGYTNDSRLWTVSDGTNNAAYSYVANSPLVSQITFKSNSVTAMTTTKQYDFLNRVTLISNAPSASAPVSFNYTYNSANQRTKCSMVDGSYWVFQYDSLGQVTSGKKYWRDGTPVAGEQFEYSFDDIGNRTQAKSGGDEAGLNLRLANYGNDSLNEMTSRNVPGYVDILGIALATNSVTVNGQTAYRKGEYFRKELNVNNISTAMWTNITVASPGQTAISGNEFLAKTNEAFAYDADGNLTNDGRWIYTWDGENRLIQMATNTIVGPQYQLSFTYDAKGRRIQKRVFLSNVPIYTNTFLYDGWNLIGELTPADTVVRSYMWGLDLSGDTEDAGGVGGLLEISCRGGTTTNCFVAFDGNGNVVVLSSANTGSILANYEYAPFGEAIRGAGPMASANPFRYSTKYQDLESDQYYFGYRYYNSIVGRWLSRDPIADIAFQSQENLRIEEAIAGKSESVNLYNFVHNEPIGGYDADGLATRKAYSIQFRKTEVTQQCGGWRNIWGIRTDVPLYSSFWVVQHVTWFVFAVPCGGSIPRGEEWWEAFKWDGKFIFSDLDEIPSHPGTRGFQAVSVKSSLYPDKAPYADDINKHWTAMGKFGRRTPNKPSWWSEDHFPNAQRLSFSTWNCCCTPTPPAFGHIPQ